MLRGSRGRRGLLLLACATAAGSSLGAASPTLLLEADPELARLLRAMALLKASMVAVALSVLWWRLRWPLSLGPGAAYLLAAAMMVGACISMWRLTGIAAAALLFHVGGLLLLFGAWIDRSGSWRPTRTQS